MIKGIVSLLVGLFLLFWPTVGFVVMAITLGVYLLNEGVNRLVSTLRYPSQGARRDFFSIITALLYLAFAAFFLLNPVGTGKFWINTMFILTGLGLVFNSLFTLWTEPSLRKDGFALSGIILVLLLGFLLMILPSFTALFLFRIIAILFILSSLASFVHAGRSR